MGTAASAGFERMKRTHVNRQTECVFDERTIVAGLSDALGMELEPFESQVASILLDPFRTDFRDKSSIKDAKTSMPERDSSSSHTARAFPEANNTVLFITDAKRAL